MRTIKLNQSIRRAAIVATAAVLLPFFVKALPAEKPLQFPAGKADTTGLAKANRTADSLLKADYPYLYAKCMEASGKGNEVAPAASKPAAGNEFAALPAEAREKDVKPAEVPAESGSNIGALYDALNKYSDLTGAEREELGKKVMASGNAALIKSYNEVKAASAPVEKPKPADTAAKPTIPQKSVETKTGPAQKKAEKPKPAEKKTGKPAEQKPVPIASNVEKPKAPPAAEKIDIGALYDQLNMYSDLGEAERAELGGKVAASGNAALIKSYNEVKAASAPAVPKAEPKKGDSSGYAVTLSPRIEERVAKKTPPEKQDARKKSLKNTEVKLYKQGATNPEVIKAVVPVNLAALKDSLEKAIGVCYDSINLMPAENFEASRARIADAIGKIEAIMLQKFPKNDPWVEYRLYHLKKYFDGACNAAGRKE